MLNTIPANKVEIPTDRASGYWRERASIAAVGFCFLYSILLIVNVHTSNEGGWYWYARLLLEGHRLYSSLHLPLQPLFVEETALFLAILGKSWIASKVPAVLHAALFCVGLCLVVRRAPALSEIEKAVFIICSFFTSLGFVVDRFDDYHVLADCFQIFAILALLKLQEAPTTRKRCVLVAAAGVLAGLSTTTRLNDGAALFVAVAAAVFFLGPAKRLLGLAVVCASTAATIVLVIALTGDSLHDWAASSVLRAAATKGGAGTVLVHPMELPASALEVLRVWQNLQFVLYLFGCALIFGWMIALLSKSRTKVRIWTAVVGISIIVLPAHRYWYRGNFEDQKLIIDFAAVSVFLIPALAVVAVSRAVYRFLPKARQETLAAPGILMLIPLGQLASGAMSSGGAIIGLYGPIAVTILLLPLVFPVAYYGRVLRGFTVGIAAILAVHMMIFKWSTPYLWQTYRAQRMFVERQWYGHPEYGPMVIDTNLLQMIQPICSTINAAHDHDPQLLSLPYPYPNYFCSIEPWHDYVQTFFDTSSSVTIFHLIDELKSAPPKWIVYQRQLQVLSLHELVYNHGQPLPHRHLDELIETKLASGEWRAVYKNDFGTVPGLRNQWLLIQTRE